jgi:hypothetical protein
MAETADQQCHLQQEKSCLSSDPQQRKQKTKKRKKERRRRKMKKMKKPDASRKRYR